MNHKTPSNGLKILSELSSKYPYHRSVKNSLINAYVKLGEHDKALAMIDNIPVNITDVQSLKFRAWKSHMYGDIKTEKSIWNDILNKQFYITIDNKPKNLILRSKKTVNITSLDIPLFCLEHNELLRLPAFLEHYRTLGVTVFFFVDNDSNDGSLEYLLKQDDCHVFWTNNSFSQAGQGISWINYLINTYLTMEQWFIVADADEFLVYPRSEKYDLSIFIQYLNKTGSEIVPSFMMDMYSRRLNDVPNKNKSFIEEHVYFYNNYQKFYQIESPYVEISGGIRVSLFSIGNFSFAKSGLIKNTQNNTYLLSSTHKTTSLKPASVTSVFKHYKFTGNFQEKIRIELERKEYYAGGLNFRDYKNALTNQLYHMDLLSLSKTTRYQNSQQLVDLGLIKTSDEWENFKK